jgi:hypothetical protein
LVATQGPVWVTAALSEVYDFQASFFLGDSLSEVLFKALPAITPTTFCQLLHRERFLDPVPPQLRGIAPRGLRGMLRLDGRYRHDPRVVLCDSQDSIVTFDETFLQAIGPRVSGSPDPLLWGDPLPAGTHQLRALRGHAD